jgi:hypothetical protein
MTPHPSVPTPPPFNPAITDAALATIFGAQPHDPDREPTQPQAPHEDGLALIAVLRPRDPLENAYAIRAAAAHYGSVECLRRAMLPDVPDNAAIRWHGRALALSRMNTDMVRHLQQRQADLAHTPAPPVVQPATPPPATPPTAAGQTTSAPPKSAGRQDPMPSERAPPAPPATAQPTTPTPKHAAGPQTPMPRERPPVTPPTPSKTARPDAVLATKPFATQNPMPTERMSERMWEPPSFVPSACILSTQADASSFLSAPPPRQGLRARLLGSTADTAAMLTPANMPARPHVQ